jgi:RNA polymerase sigma-70 factor, ECF subfamily
MITHQGPGGFDELGMIHQSQRGNSAAFGELLCRYDRAVLRLALRLTGSEPDAQDICQEAFLRAYKNIGSFRFECSFYTWLYRIVANLYLDGVRKKQARKEVKPVATDANDGEFDVLDQVPDSRASANPERELMSRELGNRISCALDGLTPRERIIVELKHYHGLKLRAIGEILNIQEGGVKSTLFCATQKLRAALSGQRSAAFQRASRTNELASVSRLQVAFETKLSSTQ